MTKKSIIFTWILHLSHLLFWMISFSDTVARVTMGIGNWWNFLMQLSGNQAKNSLWMEPPNGGDVNKIGMEIEFGRFRGFRP
jgi:hypothetical protein